MVFGVSWLWVLVAVVGYMIVGWLWYSPMLFMKQWLKAAGKKDMMATGPSLYVVTLIAELVIVLGLAWLTHRLGLVHWQDSAWLAAKAWLCFVAATALINRLFQGANRTVYMIDMSYHLVGMVVAGALLVH